MHQIARGLMDLGHQVKVVALESRQNHNQQEPLPEAYLKATAYEAQVIDNRVKLLPAFLNLFSRKSYNIQRFYSPAMERLLAQILQQQPFDIIQLEGLYLTPYIGVIRRYSKAPLIYRAHNIEHFIWQRLAAAATHPLKKKYLKLLASRLKDYEIKIVHQVDGLLAISPLDLEFFRQHGFRNPSAMIPVGVPQFRFSESGPPLQAGSVYHLGSMDWRPNQQGVEWFLEKVWPGVVQENPSAVFYLAGKNMPGRFSRFASKQVKVVGEVPDAAAFFTPLEIMVVPLLSGGGMRVKIIEGMAAAKTIVSTSIGAEGIGCENEKHLLLADTPGQMTRAILQCMQDQQMARQLGQNAREFVRQHYGTGAILENLLSFYKGFVR